MTYMVYVNQKYMVKVDIEGSMAAAEHIILDNYDGIQYAQAFDKKAMRTEYYLNTLENSEVISINELSTISSKYAENWGEVAFAEARAEVLKGEVEKLERELEEARKALNEQEDIVEVKERAAKKYQEETINLK